MSIMNIRGDSPYHKHMSRVGNCLATGLLSEDLPYLYPMEPSKRKKFEHHVQVVGVDVAKQLSDETQLRRIELLSSQLKEVAL